MNSGPMIGGPDTAEPRLVTVAELVQPYDHTCSIDGPAFSRCMRYQGHPSPCAALGTDSGGVPIVVCWWPAGMFPVHQASDPGD